MANPLKGESPLKAVGKTWTLMLPFTQAKALKTEHGIDLMSKGSEIAQIDKIDLVLFAMLQKKHPDATLDDAAAILDDVGLMPVVTAMKPALALFMGVDIKVLDKAGDDRPQ